MSCGSTRREYNELMFRGGMFQRDVYLKGKITKRHIKDDERARYIRMMKCVVYSCVTGGDGSK